jgi:hypothetical protein
VRAADLQAAFADPEIDAIQTMRGGYGSAHVIPLLDFEAIAETPKAFFGLSDITALHAALLVRAGLATFYGPSLTMFGKPSVARFTADRFLQVLSGETTGAVPEDRDRLTWIRSASSAGLRPSSSESSRVANGTSTRPRLGRRRWRTCSRIASGSSASRCSTACRWDTEQASRRFRLASKRQSMRTR